MNHIITIVKMKKLKPFEVINSTYQSKNIIFTMDYQNRAGSKKGGE